MAANKSLESFLDRIRHMRRELQDGPTHYDGNAVDFISNVELHSDPPALRGYASGVIPARIMQLYVTTRMKTLSLTELYMAGVERNIVYALPLAARAQLEIFAVVWDVVHIINQNAGLSDETFQTRVKIVDDALISAVYGARHSFLKDLLRNFGSGPLNREVSQDDLDKLTATNILTRLKRLEKQPTYSQLANAYEVLCELTHPNMLQNFLLVTYDEKKPQILRWACGSVALKRAITLTAEPMVLAAEEALKTIDSIEAPFGMGPVVRA
jgi:hypothetical protein